jgi:7-cyano-7-deazaguanine synthase
MKDEKNAVILCSGGLDSATVMAIAKNDGYDIYALSFCYGQRHEIEIEAARRVAEVTGVKEHLVLNVDLGCMGGSALTDKIDVPKAENLSEISSGIPITYVPARNTVFLSYALALAEVKKSNDIFLGVNAVDYSGYPDCRPEYIDAFEKMANLATKAGVEGNKVHIRAPLINMTKAEIIQRGFSLGVDYTITHSCYDPDDSGRACGSCDSCLFRKNGFEEAGVPDPTMYTVK